MTQPNSPPTVFVTVGTTQFQHLIDQVYSSEFLEALQALGVQHLIVQFGKSTLPREAPTQYKDVRITSFNYAPSLEEYQQKASVIVSHGGAGTIFEVLHMNKPLIAVINHQLMDNHQMELVEALEQRQYLWGCNKMQQLAPILSKAWREAHREGASLGRKKLEAPCTENFSALVEEELGLRKAKHT